MNTPSDSHGNFRLEHVQGLNLAEGLDRVAGDRALYKTVLLEFRDSYRDVTDRIWELMEAKQWREAESLVHTVKGTSGMLSADPLFTACSELDALLKSARDIGLPAPGIESAFDRMHRELARLLQDLDRLGASSEPP